MWKASHLAHRSPRVRQIAARDRAGRRVRTRFRVRRPGRFARGPEHATENLAPAGDRADHAQGHCRCDAGAFGRTVAFADLRRSAARATSDLRAGSHAGRYARRAGDRAAGGCFGRSAKYRQEVDVAHALGLYLTPEAARGEMFDSVPGHRGSAAARSSVRRRCDRAAPMNITSPARRRDHRDASPDRRMRRVLSGGRSCPRCTSRRTSHRP